MDTHLRYLGAHQKQQWEHVPGGGPWLGSPDEVSSWVDMLWCVWGDVPWELDGAGGGNTMYMKDLFDGRFPSA